MEWDLIIGPIAEIKKNFERKGIISAIIIIKID